MGQGEPSPLSHYTPYKFGSLLKKNTPTPPMPKWEPSTLPIFSINILLWPMLSLSISFTASAAFISSA